MSPAALHQCSGCLSLFGQPLLSLHCLCQCIVKQCICCIQQSADGLINLLCWLLWLIQLCHCHKLWLTLEHCVQGASNTSADKAPSVHNTTDYQPRHRSTSGQAVSQDKLSLRVPSPSPFGSSMEPVTAFQAGNFGAKFSPPPLREQSSRQNSQPRQASMPRMPSLASGGHRKRQLSFGSLDSLNTG